MLTYHESIGAALDQLTAGLRPYVERKLQQHFHEGWQEAVLSSFRDGRSRVLEDGTIDWDAHSLLTVMWDQWNAVFRTDLGHQERSLVSELRAIRNLWAHQQDFDFDDAYRVLDSTRRLLEAIGAANTRKVRRQKQELLDAYVSDQVHAQVQRAAFDRTKAWVVGIYCLCLGAIAYHAAAYGQMQTSAIVSFVILVFIYLVYQQFKLEPTLLYGPRECQRCKRIIYRTQCPYCEFQAVATPASAGT